MTDPRGLLAEYLRTRADRPFGDVESVSGRTLQPFSIALSEAATNLLTKARRALARDDAGMAVALVDRAVALPYDDHEQTAPAAWTAHLELFTTVADTLEDSAAEDSRWLDAALDVLSTAGQRARFVLRDVLEAVDNDYELHGTESRRLRAGIAEVPARAEIRDLDLTSRDLHEHVVEVLAACNAYEAAL